MTTNAVSLTNYLRELTTEDAAPRPETEAWEATMARMNSASKPMEIDEATYYWFLEVLPPRFMQGSQFCFAEGAEPFRLFWQQGGRYFVRSLDWAETKSLCRLAGIRLYD